jgi:hypothetical protein
MTPLSRTGKLSVTKGGDTDTEMGTRIKEKRTARRERTGRLS